MNLLEVQRDSVRRSKKWFPHIYEATNCPTTAYFAIALMGEAGEACNLIKKIMRDGTDADKRQAFAYELVDILIYLLLLADSEDINLEVAYKEKVNILIERWAEQRAVLR